MKKTAKKPRTITISDEPPEITADFDSLEPFDSDKIFEELDNDFFQLEKQLDEMDLSELDNFELPELDLSDIEIFNPNEIDLSFQGLDDDNFTDDFMKWLKNGDENSSGDGINIHWSTRKTPQTKKTEHTRTHNAAITHDQEQKNNI